MSRMLRNFPARGFGSDSRRTVLTAACKGIIHAFRSFDLGGPIDAGAGLAVWGNAFSVISGSGFYLTSSQTSILVASHVLQRLLC